MQVDHLVPERVAALVARIEAEQGCLHVLVNDTFYDLARATNLRGKEVARW